MSLIKIREYIDEAGQSPFAVWHDHLDARAAAKVTTALTLALATGSILAKMASVS